MRKSLSAIALLLAAIGAPAVLRANITYTVTLGTSLVTGTITTDGHTGILNFVDIVSWDLTVNDGTDGPAAITNTDSGFEDVGFDDLTATATALSFEFTGAEGFLEFVDDTTNYELCYFDSIEDCGKTANEIAVVNNNNNDTAFLAESGTQVIASVAPEPRTGALLLAGIGLLVFATRKRIGWRLV
jgi:hypothetical protein